MTERLAALAVAPDGRVAVAVGEQVSVVSTPAEVGRVVDPADRLVMWAAPGVAPLVAAGVRPARMWDLAAVHRILVGGWRADPARVWALAQGLSFDSIPVEPPVDLFHQPATGPRPAVGADGHLDPAWVAGGWAADDEALAEWARLALVVQAEQRTRLEGLGIGPRALSTARSESVAEVLAVELGIDGLPVDRGIAESIIAGSVGPRPRTDGEAMAIRAARDDEVLRHAPPGITADLRSPAQVIPLLRSVGLDVPDTRAWRLEAAREQHPLVEALLAWRKAERIATTYGYAWIDEHLGADGRMRGSWTACDGAAGRMTATASLHSMPAEFRAAVVAEPGHVFVRADLGQIEPRILAAVSGDTAFARATQDADMYLPVARQLGVERAIAKVAILGAMYGSTTGQGAHALRRLHERYPVAMAYLDAAARDGEAGNDLRTYGGRLIRLGIADEEYEMAARDARSRAAARGRYARNALIQGAAAEFFKRWAVTVRARGSAIGAQIVMCLHDELLVQVRAAHADDGVRLLDDCLQETARGWAPDRSVRFIADVSVVARWSDAK